MRCISRWGYSGKCSRIEGYPSHRCNPHRSFPGSPGSLADRFLPSFLPSLEFSFPSTVADDWICLSLSLLVRNPCRRPRVQKRVRPELCRRRQRPMKQKVVWWILLRIFISGRSFVDVLPKMASRNRRTRTIRDGLDRSRRCVSLSLCWIGSTLRYFVLFFNRCQMDL